MSANTKCLSRRNLAQFEWEISIILENVCIHYLLRWYVICLKPISSSSFLLFSPSSLRTYLQNILETWFWPTQYIWWDSFISFQDFLDRNAYLCTIQHILKDSDVLKMYLSIFYLKCTCLDSKFVETKIHNGTS